MGVSFSFDLDGTARGKKTTFSYKNERVFIHHHEDGVETSIGYPVPDIDNIADELARVISDALSDDISAAAFRFARLYAACANRYSGGSASIDERGGKVFLRVTGFSTTIALGYED